MQIIIRRPGRVTPPVGLPQAVASYVLSAGDPTSGAIMDTLNKAWQETSNGTDADSYASVRLRQKEISNLFSDEASFQKLINAITNNRQLRSVFTHGMAIPMDREIFHSFISTPKHIGQHKWKTEKDDSGGFSYLAALDGRKSTSVTVYDLMSAYVIAQVDRFAGCIINDDSQLTLSTTTVLRWLTTSSQDTDALMKVSGVSPADISAGWRKLANDTKTQIAQSIIDTTKEGDATLLALQKSLIDSISIDHSKLVRLMEYFLFVATGIVVQPEPGYDFIYDRFDPAKGDLVASFENVVANAVKVHVYDKIIDAFDHVESNSSPDIMERVGQTLRLDKIKLTIAMKGVRDRFSSVMLNLENAVANLRFLPDVSGYVRAQRAGIEATQDTSAILSGVTDPFGATLNAEMFGYGFVTPVDENVEVFDAKSRTTMVAAIANDNNAISTAISMLESSLQHEYSSLQKVTPAEYASMFFVKRVEDPDVPGRTFHIDIGYDVQFSASNDAISPLLVEMSRQNEMHVGRDAQHIPDLGYVIEVGSEASGKRALFSENLQLSIAPNAQASEIANMMILLQSAISTDHEIDYSLFSPVSTHGMSAIDNAEEYIAVDDAFWRGPAPDAPGVVGEVTDRARNLGMRQCPDLWMLAMSTVSTSFGMLPVNKTFDKQQLPRFTGLSRMSTVERTHLFDLVEGQPGGSNHRITSRSPLLAIAATVELPQTYGMSNLQEDPLKRLGTLSNPRLSGSLVSVTEKKLTSGRSGKNYKVLHVNENVAFQVALGGRTKVATVTTPTLRVPTTRIVSGVRKSLPATAAPEEIVLPYALSLPMLAKQSNDTTMYLLGSQLARDAIGETIANERNLLRYMGYLFAFSGSRVNADRFEAVEGIVAPDTREKFSFTALRTGFDRARTLLSSLQSDTISIREIAALLANLRSAVADMDELRDDDVLALTDTVGSGPDKLYDTLILAGSTDTDPTSVEEQTIIHRWLRLLCWNSPEDSMVGGLTKYKKGNFKYSITKGAFVAATGEFIDELNRRLVDRDGVDAHKQANMVFAFMCSVSGAFRIMTSSSSTSWIHPLRSGDSYEVVGDNKTEHDVFLSYFTNALSLGGDDATSAKDVRTTSLTTEKQLSNARTRTYVKRSDASSIDQALSSNGARLFLCQMAMRSTSECESAAEALRTMVINHVLDFMSSNAWMKCMNDSLAFGYRLSNSGWKQFPDARTIGYTPTNLYNVSLKSSDVEAMVNLTSNLFDDYVMFFRFPKAMNVLINFVKNHEINTSTLKRIVTERESNAKRGQRRIQ